MKRTLLSVSLLATAVLAFGQRHRGEQHAYDTPYQNLGERGTDTVWAVSGDLTLYGASGGGYVIGNNGYGDKAKAQALMFSGDVVIDELLFFFGGKTATSGDPASKVVAKVWAMDGTGTSSTSETAAAPGTTLAAADININDVDTTGAFTSAMVGPLTASSVAVGIDVTTLAAGDTVGLTSTQFGTASSTDATWELWSDDVWHTILEAWGDDLDIGVAVVLTPVVGMEEPSLNGMTMVFQNGNVVDDRLNITYSLEQATDASLRVHDATGRQVINERLGNRSAGTHNLSLDMAGLGAGQYYVTLVTNGTGLSKKIVKR